MNDLLSPTLTEEDEPFHIEEQWNPNAILFITFFFGLLTGGLLLAYNFVRLGMGKYFRPTITIAIVFTILISIVSFLLVRENIIDTKERKDRTMLRSGQRGFSLLVAFFIVRKQRKRYRLAKMCDVDNGSLWLPAILAIVASIFISGFINAIVKTSILGI